ncbi:MAG: GNAT family N-acetyltransferase [Planctomycetota bacterium]
MSVEIRPATLAEFDQVVAVINRSFGTSIDAPMETIYPWLFRRTPEAVDAFLIALVDGEIVANVSVFPMEAVIDGAHLKAAGIGMVGTVPERRGTGMMTELLHATVRRLEEMKVDISLLGGDRQRYGRHGWEVAGRRLVFLVTARSLAQAGRFGHVVRRAERGDAPFIHAVHEGERVRIERTLAATELSIDRRTYDTWVAERNEAPDAYLVRYYGTVVESGGNPEGLLDILRHLLVGGDVQSLKVALPVQADERSRMLFSFASRWEIEAGWMVRICDFVSTLTKLAGTLQQNARRIGATPEGEVGIEDVDAGRSVRISCAHGTVRVEEARSRRQLALSRRDLVRVIFGIERPGSILVTGDEARVLDALFPVDYFIWGHDTF